MLLKCVAPKSPESWGKYEKFHEEFKENNNDECRSCGENKFYLKYCFKIWEEYEENYQITCFMERIRSISNIQK